MAGGAVMRADRMPVRARPGAGSLQPKLTGRRVMHIPKDRILELLRSRGQNDTASHAEGELPDLVDTVGDADLLHQLGIDPLDIVGALGGGAGVGESSVSELPWHR
jgi:hypothetical protein